MTGDPKERLEFLWNGVHSLISLTKDRSEKSGEARFQTATSRHSNASNKVKWRVSLTISNLCPRDSKAGQVLIE